MNDPGLESPIKESAEKVEKEENDNVNDEDPDGVDDEEAYQQPSRWWFASTAFPLLAGTFGPMASAFNICALAAKWRVEVGPGESEDDGFAVQDPEWLIGINAVSLALALIANFSLLLNMARRISFSVALPITIIGWCISGFILIGLVVAAVRAPSFQLPAEKNPHFSQAFYYAIMAAALYLIISLLLMVTAYGALAGHYPRDFKLTMSQRTLMIQTIGYLTYILAGGAVFARIEDWLFLNGVYWANTTLLTVGTGDFSPTTHTGQSLLFPYAIGGIVHLGLVVGSIRSLVLDRGKKKLGARMIEKTRKEVVRQLQKNESSSKGQGKDKRQHELQRRKDEFKTMRHIQAAATSRRKWMALATSSSAWFTLWFVGAAVFYAGERGQQGMTFFEAIYFSYVSLLTIGYGDYAPVANSSKAFFVFWSLLAVPTLTILISNMGDTVVQSVKDLSIWFGEVTILPGDKPVMDSVRVAARRIKQKPFSGHIDEAKSPESRASDIKGEAERAAHEEFADYVHSKTNGRKFEHDSDFHRYLLAKEIGILMDDMQNSPSRKYAFREWAWFLKLLGEDEGNHQLHREPLIKNSKENSAPANHMPTQEEIKEEDKWSWIGGRSPLLGEEDEAAWLMKHLAEKLKKLLHSAHIESSTESE